jgi:hypothetical protein
MPRRPKLHPHWRMSWRWFSVQAMALAGAVQIAFQALPAEMKSSIPDSVISKITLTILFLGIVGRMIDQGEK